MKENITNGICPLCKGTKRPGTTTFTVDLGFGVVVIRNVPALVCSQCGADWIEDEVAKRIERVIEEARVKRSQVEVTALY
jgi:YgiT-type zinc finger domain-containing protein